MKKFFFIALTLLFFIYSCDERKNDKIADDNLVKEKMLLGDSTTVQLIDSIFDFGTIQEGEKVTRSYRFKNSGDKALIISKASASCGCTKPETPDKPILPGDTGTIKVTFNSKGKVGHNEKNITVHANTIPDFPILLLTGNVTKSEEENNSKQK